jgi:hypothetical protein
MLTARVLAIESSSSAGSRYELISQNNRRGGNLDRRCGQAWEARCDLLLFF